MFWATGSKLGLWQGIWRCIPWEWEGTNGRSSMRTAGRCAELPSAEQGPLGKLSERACGPGKSRGLCRSKRHPPPMARKGSGTGLRINKDGYLRIGRRGPYRDKLAHRAYVERQIGRPLRSDEEVHHLCRNRQCWPPTDFHLLLLDAALHEAFEAGAAPNLRAKQNGAKK